MTAVQVIFPAKPTGSLNTVDSIADLRAVDSSGLDEDTNIVVSGAGIFQWDGASLAVDDGFGIIKPDDKTSLQAGRWLIAVGGSSLIVDVGLFGAVGGGVTDDYPAFAAAAAYLATLKLPALGDDGSDNAIYSSLPTLRIPLARYYLGQTWELKLGTFNIDADLGSRLLFPANITGIIVHRDNTTGETTTSSTTAADRSLIRNLVVQSAGGTSSKHGFHLRARALLINCAAIQFPGDGFHIEATAGGGGSAEGNANNWYMEQCQAIRNGRHGLYIQGADTNAGNSIGFSAIANGRFGIYDDSFLGNTHVGAHTEANGYYGSSGPYANPNSVPTLVSQGGNRYSVVIGQEVAAKTTTPGTNSAIWTLVEPGGATSEIPAWVSGTTVAAGGAYAGVNANARNVFLGCYAEGSQGSSQMPGGLSIVVGGLHGVPIRGGINLRGVGAGVLGMDSLKLSGATTAGTVSIEFLNSEIANEASRVLTHSAYAPSGYHEKFVTANYYLPYAYNGQSATSPFSITTAATAEQFGTGVSQPHLLNVATIALGSRKQTASTAAPTTGAHAQGEIVWNTAPAAAGTLGWVCVTSGTPGTWKAISGIAA